MASSPRFKVYRGKEYVAACHYVEDAAAIVALSPTGATIRSGHSTSDILWTEGIETQPAGESVDTVANVVWARLKERIERAARTAEGGVK